MGERPRGSPGARGGVIGAGKGGMRRGSGTSRARLSKSAAVRLSAVTLAPALLSATATARPIPGGRRYETRPGPTPAPGPPPGVTFAGPSHQGPAAAEAEMRLHAPAGLWPGRAAGRGGSGGRASSAIFARFRGRALPVAEERSRKPSSGSASRQDRPTEVKFRGSHS